jgi:riboflavin synthase
MFTGLIEAICTVKSIGRSGGGMLLAIDLGKLAEDSKIGDSIAINGVCLTVSRLDGSVADFDVSSETLTKSNLGKLSAGSKVNAERAMRAGDRFGGHFVAGHIDGTATIKGIEKLGQFANMEFTASPELLSQMVAKGSVAVDGISLTIAGMDEDSFSVALIPQTLKKTTLGEAKIGDCVNIEADIIVKTIKKQLESALGGLPQKQPLTVEKLKAMGF